MAPRIVRAVRDHEDDARGVADGDVLTRERQPAARPIHAKDGNGVGSLVGAVQEPPRWIEGEAARIVSARPFFADIRQAPVGADREDPDAVVQAVAGYT